METIPRDLLDGWSILVIDDEEDSAEVASIILLEYGAEVHVAADGQEGLQIARDVNPRIIISDISMPVMDGWGFIDAVMADPALVHIPVIALTAHAMVGDSERALAAGFYNYLTKPLTVNTFMQDLIKILIDIPELVEYLNI
jgi:two-component system response regulator